MKTLIGQRKMGKNIYHRNIIKKAEAVVLVSDNVNLRIRNIANYT